MGQYYDQCQRIKNLEDLANEVSRLHPLVQREEVDWGEKVYEILNEMNLRLDTMYARRERFKREFFKLNGRFPVETGNE